MFLMECLFAVFCNYWAVSVLVSLPAANEVKLKLEACAILII